MHRYPEYFAHRHTNDELDCVPLLAAGLRRDPARTIVHFEDRAISCEDAARHVVQLQRWFAAQGLKQGDRVAVMLGNSPEHIHLIYALHLSGLVWVPVNTKLRAAGLEYLLQHAEPKLFVVDDEFDAVTAQLDCGAARRTHLPGFDARDTSTEFATPAIGVHDPLCIIYTSGTTGAPKGVVFTHRMMRIASEAALRVADVRDSDRLFLWEPLCHIGGAQMLLLPFLANVTLHAVPRFSASQFWPQIERAGATQLHYLGGVLDILMQLPEREQPAKHTLRVAWGAGVSASSWEPIQTRLKVSLRECYGMTECSSFATANVTGKAGSIGRALPWIDIALLDENGRPVKEGEAGEIVLTSKIEGTFLPAYLKNPDATRAALRNGRLHTGDRARRDADGDLFFIGRQTDSMRVRGENVSAWEIERIFAAHPAIRASAAIGVASAIGEQDILLDVQFKDEPVEWQALHAWACERLASFQLPRYYRAVAGFEMTASERVKKHLLSRDTGNAWDRLATAKQ
ncbi:MAG: Long-chain-fatty-acid--CoA ligase (EC [uncultured Paraburkholderia sp.]|uniref:AMP-binding protein n=1 Tax=uncultured Paraburkholderia sp. TaxID=1822466 RepID=UPI002591D6E5|nr:AMP-binding protein [uncultured Paraburkholderia sp.]CAH2894019.1 MAG: Long-chain-fatty-acid--CoA ligase (EC [uncultured Paraburkholderia sp.]CAH2912363.1 MAG: Long-chain-fatty-acid--CoA ligase (EC [uncultured Paraburkholderia sp.]